MLEMHGANDFFLLLVALPNLLRGAVLSLLGQET